jgi:hypothetical protein
MDNKNTENTSTHSTIEISSTIPSNKSVFNTEAQKELIKHSFRLSFKYMLYTFLVIVPLVLLMVFGFVYLLSNR